MRCPSCRRDVVGQRTSEGVPVACRASRRFVVSGLCPHPSCGVRLFAWTDAPDEPPTSVATARGFLAWRRHARPPLVAAREVVPAFFVGLLMALFFALATWSMLRTLELSPDLTSRVIFGVGPALVVASQIGFAWLAVRDALEIRARDRALAGAAPAVAHAAPGGLRLLADPSSYRR